MKNKAWFVKLGQNVESADNPTAFRTQRFKIALVSSLAGKGVSIVSQLLALPLAISALGVDRFGIYAMLVALLTWVNMATVAITPGLTVQIVDARSTGEREAEVKVFTTALLFAVAAALCVFIGVRLFIHAVGIEHLFGRVSLPYLNEVDFGLQILLAFMSLSLVLCVVEGAQAGYQNQFINNLFGMLGSIFNIIAIVVIVVQSPSIPDLILAIYGVPLFARILNAVHLFWFHRHLLPQRRMFSFAALRAMLTTSSAFLLTALGTFFYQSFSIYWVGHELGPAYAAQMSVMMLVLNLAGSLLITVTQPLWPAIQDALKRGDLPWVRSAYRRILRTLVPYIALAAIALALGGEYILGFWLKSGVHIDLTKRLLWGVYFFIVTWEHLNYTVLMGMSRFWFASVIFSAGALVMVVASVLLVQKIGIDGLFISLCLGPLLLSTWLYPLEIRRLLSGRLNATTPTVHHGQNGAGR